jgi:cell division protein FtsL
VNPPRRGRRNLALAMAVFLAVASSVVWRRSLGSAAARRLHVLVMQRTELEAERARLVGEIRKATSQVELVPVVTRLGMRFPSDDQVVFLPLSDLELRR